MSEEDVKKQYNESNWGKLLIRAGFEPYDTESAARTVAKHAAEEIDFLNTLISDLISHEGAEGFSESTNELIKKWNEME